MCPRCRPVHFFPGLKRERGSGTCRPAQKLSSGPGFGPGVVHWFLPYSAACCEALCRDFLFGRRILRKDTPSCVGPDGPEARVVYVKGGAWKVPRALLLLRGAFTDCV